METKDMAHGYAKSRLWYAFEAQGKLVMLMDLFQVIQLMKSQGKLSNEEYVKLKKVVMPIMERIRDATKSDLPTDEYNKGYVEMLNSVIRALDHVSKDQYEQAWKEIYKVREFAIPIWNDIYDHSKLTKL